jgi:RNA polymerase sigma-70 factor (ECF subfamily)
VKLIDNVSLLRTFKDDVLIAYISVASKNVALDYIKKQKVQSKWVLFGEGEDENDMFADSDNTPEELLYIKEDSENLHKILDRLPEKHRLILQFKYFYEMNNNDIAKILDIAPGSVKVYISRARKAAYKLFKEGGVEYAPE